ncbi:ABC transporter substrate-binding protein [Bacillus sp. 1P06AnD]|uniref:ABC transporter substrate-binding protein n=1 Tax=Bacillus sp. 1P06AnD TaxID=3132208 RepID=UPI0039A172C3
MKKKLSIICMMFLVLFSLSACKSSSTSGGGSDSAQGNSKGKIMYVGMVNPPGGVNPINATDVPSQYISSILFESLFELSDDMEFLPKLAKSIETADNQTFVIKLDPKAKWTDGKPFTVNDITFTLNTMANPATVSTGLQALSVIEGLDSNGYLPEGKKEISGLEKIDDHTLNIKTKKPVDMDLIKDKLGVSIRFLPEHVLKDKDPATLHQDPFMQKPTVTDGAFTFVQYAKDQYVELAANKEYYRGAPKLSKVFFKIMPTANIVAQLQTGEIQMDIPSIGPIATEDFEKVKNMTNVKFVSGKPLYTQYLFFNTKIIHDKKVRQAVAYAIDREMLANDLFKEGQVSEGPYSPVHPYYNEEAKKYEFNPEKAKQLLKEAGWNSGKALTLAIPSGNTTREQAANIIAENLKAVGIKVQVNKYDLPTLIQQAKKKDFDILMLGIPFQFDPDLTAFYSTKGVNNFSGYSNPQMDALIEQGKAEVNPEKRKAIYNQIVDIIQEEMPTFTFSTLSAGTAVSNSVATGMPKDNGMFYDIHQWDFK